MFVAATVTVVTRPSSVGYHHGDVPPMDTVVVAVATSACFDRYMYQRYKTVGVIVFGAHLSFAPRIGSVRVGGRTAHLGSHKPYHFAPELIVAYPTVLRLPMDSAFHSSYSASPLLGSWIGLAS